mmetsp:Transcript_71602/g.202366  ORF Transcript_71602/g.202366 Transcript_71602/m.202366 type:complete len:275 (-) Transcript_71602:1803-2627(-)
MVLVATQRIRLSLFFYTGVRGVVPAAQGVTKATILRLLTTMAAASSSVSTGWESMWARGLKAGQAFDASRTEPAFTVLIEGQGKDYGWSAEPLPTGRALVPGCGRGYAVASLVCEDRRVVGLEISPTAADAANAYLDSALSGSSRESASIEIGDFFETEGLGSFNLGYDCTFLCAIPPESRARWATKWAELLADDGELVTLIFPVKDGGADPADTPLEGPGGGPPYAMSPRLVKELLEAAGFEQHTLEEVPKELGARSFAGEWIGRWRKAAQVA